MKLKKNDIITLKTENITNLGFGVAKHSGEVVFIADTVPEDTVRAKIIKAASSYYVARVEEYIEKSPLRAERCHVDACKSCAYKCISYEHELKIKHETVISDFRKAGLSDIEILPPAPSPKEHFYRNKAQYPVAPDGKGGYKIGFFAPKSHRVTEASNCPLTPAIFSEIIEEVRAYLSENALSAYDEQSAKGLIRHIYIRRGEVSGEILLTLVINSKKIPNEKALTERITKKFPMIVGILLNINEESTNVILGKEFITLYGRDYIYDTLAGVKLRISAAAFYQVNHGAAELLYKKAHELAAPTSKDSLLDLYCGAGSIGLSMANDARELIGIEIIDSAVICARLNAKENGIENAHFFSGDAKYTERMLYDAEASLGRKINPDIIILDPPRAGCAKELISFVSSLNSQRIVYISCNPATLARDIAIFRELGFDTSAVHTFDLFPLTGHVESVCLLSKSHAN